ncbi:MAG: acyltransferase family protein [Gemmataceae bacterium]
MAYSSKASDHVPSGRAIVGLDALRALACLWVISHHVFQHLAYETRRESYLASCLVRGHLGVAIFFVLSGFLLATPFWKSFRKTNGLPNLKVYAARRLGRIVPEYFLCLIICGFLTGQLLTRADALNLVPSFLFLNSFFWWTFLPIWNNPPLWSIGIEMLFYAMLPLFALGMQKARTRARAWTFGLAVIALIIAVHCFVLKRIQIQIPDDRELTHTELLGSSMAIDLNGLILFTHFLIGVFAADLYLAAMERSPHRKREARKTFGFNRFDGIALILLAAVFLVDWDGLPFFWRISSRMAAWGLAYHWPYFHLLIMGLLLALPFSRIIGPILDNRFMRWTAAISFGLYMWHMPLLGWLETIWPSQLDGTVSGRLLLEAVLLVGTYCLASISYYFIGLPILRRAHQIGTSKPAPLHPNQEPIPELGVPKPTEVASSEASS